MTLAVVIVCYNRMSTSKHGSSSTSATTIVGAEDAAEQSSAWDSLSFNHSRNDLNNIANEFRPRQDSNL
ncbi:hypothetical protein L596_015388 [Steinernema carpocapsae]|uniref:Uncharacterized protein n=1 Tax=Steinernema carpocapsae TaxID=34508 RepID=A0A4U5NFF2_STECR|nr:hypothetical protein L596_015388 [Steinernema carpocapsae]